MTQATPTSDDTVDKAAAPLTLRRTITLATLGNVLEWYDFTVYGFLAPYIAVTFFPGEDKLAALLSTFAVFAVGFIARPVGALILGPLVDRRGRKSVMLISMLLMAFGSLLLAVAPGYAVIGITGAVIIVVGRLCQGFSAGGEFGSSGVFIVEWARHGRRGFYGSFHQVASYGGLLIGVLLTAALTSGVGKDVMGAWAWRIPFLVGACLAVIVFFLRRRIQETPVFTEIESERAQVENNVAGEEAAEGKQLGAVAGFFVTLGIVALWGVTSMVALTYMPTYTSTVIGIDSQLALWATTIGAALTVVLLPVAGHVSDRVGRKPLILTAAIGYIVVSIPLFLLMTSTKAYWAVVVTQVVLAIFTAPIAGVGTAASSELFTARRRGALFSIASAIAVAAFGGFGTYISTWLITVTDKPASPAFYITAVAVITLIAAVFLPRGLATDKLRK